MSHGRLARRRAGRGWRGLAGFTLIEALIVVALVALLVTLAMPSYEKFVLRSNRGLAKARLLDIVEKQARYYIDNRAYGDLSDLGFSADTVGLDDGGLTTAGSGWYDLSVSANSASDFTLRAVARNRQLGDTGCTTLTVNLAGVRTPADCW